MHTVVSGRGRSLRETAQAVLAFYQDCLGRGGVRALFEVRHCLTLPDSLTHSLAAVLAAMYH